MGGPVQETRAAARRRNSSSSDPGSGYIGNSSHSSCGQHPTGDSSFRHGLSGTYRSRDATRHTSGICSRQLDTFGSPSNAYTDESLSGVWGD